MLIVVLLLLFSMDNGKSMGYWEYKIREAIHCSFVSQSGRYRLSPLSIVFPLHLYFVCIPFSSLLIDYIYGFNWKNYCIFIQTSDYGPILVDLGHLTEANRLMCLDELFLCPPASWEC